MHSVQVVTELPPLAVRKFYWAALMFWVYAEQRSRTGYWLGLNGRVHLAKMNQLSQRDMSLMPHVRRASRFYRRWSIYNRTGITRTDDPQAYCQNQINIITDLYYER